MTVEAFVKLLALFSVISSLTVEAIKKITTDTDKRYNMMVMIVALIVGILGTLVYFQFTGLGFSVNNIITSILMGFASGVSSMVGYDKVKQAILQIRITKEGGN